MSSGEQAPKLLRLGIRLRRLLAWCIDWGCILGWIAIVAAVGIPLYRAGVVSLHGPLAENLVGLVVVIPVVAAAAWLESSPGSATPGKRALGLSVRFRSPGRRLPRAVLRNGLKIGVPWAIGHLAVFAIVDAGSRLPGWVGWLTAAAYVLPVLWLLSLLLPGARTIYDRLSRTEVR
jgi:hypothetical protein